eukprot:6210217-Pleurochrysis_carterae.AAC.1
MGGGGSGSGRVIGRRVERQKKSGEGVKERVKDIYGGRKGAKGKEIRARERKRAGKGEKRRARSREGATGRSWSMGLSERGE